MVRLQRRVADQTSKLEVRPAFLGDPWYLGLLMLSRGSGCAADAPIRVQAMPLPCRDPCTPVLQQLLGFCCATRGDRRPKTTSCVTAFPSPWRPVLGLAGWGIQAAVHELYWSLHCPGQHLGQSL